MFFEYLVIIDQSRDFDVSVVMVFNDLGDDKSSALDERIPGCSSLASLRLLPTMSVTTGL